MTDTYIPIGPPAFAVRRTPRTLLAAAAVAVLCVVLLASSSRRFPRPLRVAPPPMPASPPTYGFPGDHMARHPVMINPHGLQVGPASHAQPPPLHPRAMFHGGMSTRVPSGCTNWKLVEAPTGSDYAIVESVIRVADVGNSVLNSATKYRIRGSARMTHDLHSWNMGEQFFGYPNVVKCRGSNFDANRFRGGQRWEYVSKKLMKQVGIADSTTKTSVLGGPGAENGDAADGLGQWAVATKAHLESTCKYGYVGVVTYPVSLGTDTEAYAVSGNIEVLDGDGKLLIRGIFDPRRTGGVGSRLAECWGKSFQDIAMKGTKTCVQKAPIILGGKKTSLEDIELGEVQIETVVKAWVKGPLVDGEIQNMYGTKIYPFRNSYYGPISKTCS